MISDLEKWLSIVSTRMKFCKCNFPNQPFFSSTDLVFFVTLPKCLQCKKIVLEYGPLVFENAEKLLEKTDICTALHACKESTVVLEKSFLSDLLSIFYGNNIFIRMVQLLKIALFWDTTNVKYFILLAHHKKC